MLLYFISFRLQMFDIVNLYWALNFYSPELKFLKDYLNNFLSPIKVEFSTLKVPFCQRKIRLGILLF